MNAFHETRVDVASKHLFLNSRVTYSIYKINFFHRVMEPSRSSFAKPPVASRGQGPNQEDMPEYQNTLIHIDGGNKSADEVLKDRRKFLEISDAKKSAKRVLNLLRQSSLQQTPIRSRMLFRMLQDQVVFAKTSSGESRGCAFVTVRWRDFICIIYDCSDRLKQMMRIDGIKYLLKYGTYIWAADTLFSMMSHGRIRGRQVFVELVRSQRRN